MRITLLACLAGLAAVAVPAQAPNLDAMDIVLKSVPDGPVAKVSGRLLSRVAYIRLYQAELAAVMRQNKTTDVPDAARAQLGLRCMGLLIERELLYDEAMRRGVTVPAEHVEKAWQAQLAQTQQMIKERENKDMTEAEVLALLGFTNRDEVFANISRALVTEKMRATVIRESDIKIDESEVKQAFDADKKDYGVPAKLQFQQIFINPVKINGTRAEKQKLAREKADQALARLMSGQSFEGVARAMSDAPGAENGGDMGMLPVTALPPFLVNAAATMKPGEVSDVIESTYGFHIVKLVNVAAPVEAGFEENERAVRNALLSERGAKAVHEFCDKLVQNGAEVEVYLELEKNLILNGALPAG